MNDGPSARQQIVEKIKNSTNILVTVSTNPSVDELSAALGLTSMLNGLNKHATAVVSGDVPPAITFLEPSKTFENTVDSLRDFIIALDKEKADHLRYKVEGDVVKIFITPYRTTISQDDLEFSQGDYNVELVLALGVKDKDNLDKALQAHGKILHDATVATLSCGENPSELGQIDWFEPNASGLSEMLVSMSEALKADKPILDEQIATAFLTGIVASTDRFSNNRTSSKVMTMAAQLMAAGANQQLIAAKLEEAHAIGPDKSDSGDATSNTDGTTNLSEGQSTKVSKQESESKAASAAGELAINHEKKGDLDEVAIQTAVENQAEAAKTAEEELAEQLSQVAPTAANSAPAGSLGTELANARAELDSQLPEVKVQEPDAEEPSLGGTLNATAEQAQHDTEAEIAADRNKTILSHNSGKYIGDSQPTFQAPFNATAAEAEEPDSVDIFSEPLPVAETAPALPPAEPQLDEALMPPAEILEDIDRKNRTPDGDVHAEARSAVELAYEATPLPAPPSVPVQTDTAPIVQEAVAEQAEPLAPPPFVPPTDVLPPVAAPVDFSQLPPPPPLPVFGPPQGPLPPEQLGQIFGAPSAPDVSPPLPPAPDTPNDPNQFKIPGQ
ncbi:MAG: hypothetical protein QG649_760 [Patescibacteria group bacterium]|nr:hypothetical protein [Patescibacteria group bacterium]